MGKVVQLDTAEQEQARARRRRRRASKTAVVLGGGGFTGGVYEIGALRALDLLAVNRTVNEFDVYVGTSAGSFVASMLANGITPEEMMRVLNRRLPSPIKDLDQGTLLKPNYRGFASNAALFPLRLLGAARELYLTATDLDTTERVILGKGEWADVPISTAVAASAALPMIYSPVELRGRQFVDGGIRSTTNVDVAVEHGAKFIVVVNPLVPFVNDFRKQIPTVFGARVRRVSDMGFAGVGNQAFRILSHDRLHRAVEDWERKYPGVDIILIEPEPDDELMFGTSILDYSARLRIAKHGFESVTLRLARDYERYRVIAERHGIEISARRVSHVLDQVEREHEEISAWRRVLEQTTSALLRQTGSE